jgi:dATP pyrophosphohydrolase
MNVRYNHITCFVARPALDGKGYELLQMKRAPGDYLGGTWQVVRGTVEAGETAVQGALRELREETGLTPRQFFRGACVESYYIDDPDTLWHSVVFCVIVDRADAVTLNEEHVEYRWIAQSEFVDHVTWSSERQVLEPVIRDILNNGPAKELLRIANKG